MAIIPNTLEVEDLWVSAALVEEARKNPDMEVSGDLRPLPFDGAATWNKSNCLHSVRGRRVSRDLASLPTAYRGWQRNSLPTFWCKLLFQKRLRDWPSAHFARLPLFAVGSVEGRLDLGSVIGAGVCIRALLRIAVLLLRGGKKP